MCSKKKKLIRFSQNLAVFELLEDHETFGIYEHNPNECNWTIFYKTLPDVSYFSYIRNNNKNDNLFYFYVDLKSKFKKKKNGFTMDLPIYNIILCVSKSTSRSCFHPLRPRESDFASFNNQNLL